jgi:hypothetical protein
MSAAACSLLLQVPAMHRTCRLTASSAPLEIDTDVPGCVQQMCSSPPGDNGKVCSLVLLLLLVLAADWLCDKLLVRSAADGICFTLGRMLLKLCSIAASVQAAPAALATAAVHAQQCYSRVGCSSVNIVSSYNDHGSGCSNVRTEHM